MTLPLRHPLRMLHFHVVAVSVSISMVGASIATAGGEAPIESSRDEAVSLNHVYGLVDSFSDDLDHLRMEMGRPKVGQSLYVVEDASLNNVLEIAFVLLTKTNRRANEFAIDSLAAPLRNEHSTDPSTADVLAVVETANEQLGRINDRLGIEHEHVHHDPQAETATTNDIIEAILRCNRQLNLLMDEPLMPSEVYSKISLCTTYVRSMHGERCDLALIERVDFIPHQRPFDVFVQLQESNRIVSEIGKRVGVTTPTLKFVDNAVIAPSDVHDLSVLILSNLRSIHIAMTSEPGNYNALHYPGPRFPSHVHQRVRMLNSLLSELHLTVERQELLSSEARAQ